jgi:hypothetical protein
MAQKSRLSACRKYGQRQCRLYQFCMKEHKCNESTVAMSAEEHEDHNWLRVIASYLMEGPYKKEGVYEPANDWERQVSLR